MGHTSQQLVHTPTINSTQVETETLRGGQVDPRSLSDDEAGHGKASEDKREGPGPGLWKGRKEETSGKASWWRRGGG